MSEPYAIHPSVAYARAILDNLPAKTGRTLDAWIGLVRTEAPADTAARRAWLEERHRLGGTTARMIVDRAEGRWRWVEAMYALERLDAVDAEVGDWLRHAYELEG